MLVPFRKKCKVHRPNKPVKYGLKIMCLADVQNHFLHSSYIYIGKDSDVKTLNEEEKISEAYSICIAPV